MAFTLNEHGRGFIVRDGYTIEIPDLVTVVDPSARYIPHGNIAYSRDEDKRVFRLTWDPRYPSTVRQELLLWQRHSFVNYPHLTAGDVRDPSGRLIVDVAMNRVEELERARTVAYAEMLKHLSWELDKLLSCLRDCGKYAANVIEPLNQGIR